MIYMLHDDVIQQKQAKVINMDLKIGQRSE